MVESRVSPPKEENEARTQKTFPLNFILWTAHASFTNVFPSYQITIAATLLDTYVLINGGQRSMVTSWSKSDYERRD